MEIRLRTHHRVHHRPGLEYQACTHQDSREEDIHLRVECTRHKVECILHRVEEHKDVRVLPEIFFYRSDHTYLSSVFSPMHVVMPYVILSHVHHHLSSTNHRYIYKMFLTRTVKVTNSNIDLLGVQHYIWQTSFCTKPVFSPDLFKVNCIFLTVFAEQWILFVYFVFAWLVFLYSVYNP